MSALSRRELLGRTLGLVTSVTAAGLVLSRSAAAAGACADAASESLRSSLRYEAVFANAAQACRACAFFTPLPDSAGCGNCAILSGPADATGHCESWSPRS
jgi:hypothetical protein